MNDVKLKWLNKPIINEIGTTWCIPWEKGKLNDSSNILITDNNGNLIPTQNWVLSYWSDGSIKCTAHAAVVSKEVGDEIYAHIAINESQTENSNVIKIFDENQYIDIDTGAIRCRINKCGNKIIEFIKAQGKEICSGIKNICITQKENSFLGSRTIVEDELETEIISSVVEQSGPIRCVIKINGRHLRNTRMKFDNSTFKQGWLPFEIRLYFYADLATIKVVHTFIYNGNPNQDFIKGVGFEFIKKMNSPLYNRFVRFGGDTGLFCESPKNLIDILRVEKYYKLFQKQLNGEIIEFNKNEDKEYLEDLYHTPEWNDFLLQQDSSEHYVIKKSTSSNCAYIKAAEGERSLGFAYVGDSSGGIGISKKDFWQKYPSAFEVKDITTQKATLKMWLWSPFGEVMDLRHYDVKTYTSSSYEGFDEIRSTPYGIANTNEFYIYCFDAMPTSEELLDYAKNGTYTHIFVSDPEYYHKTGIFGVWGMADLNSSKKAKVEELLAKIVEFYIEEVDRRKWYGFWNYGDIMHSYDMTRHTWKYDVGGYTWQNTELVPNMWLWYMFLRTGRADIFKLAEAMTRHTSEVDMYHLGEYKGLGSRHNVIHWGCGCKEARITMAHLHRFYYYLTADERIGDIMEEVKDIDRTVVNMDPMRIYFTNDKEHKVHIRVGPDVMAFCSNWFVRWERFKDEKYKQKIVSIINYLKNNPAAFISGGVFDYDCDKVELKPIEYTGGANFVFCFGNPFVWLEIAKDFGDKEFERLLVEQGLFYTDFKLNKDKILTSWGVPNNGFKLNIFNLGVAAIAAKLENIPELAEIVWDNLLNVDKNFWIKFLLNKTEYFSAITINTNVEIPFISTNTVSPWSLNVILALEYIGDFLK